MKITIKLFAGLKCENKELESFAQTNFEFNSNKEMNIEELLAKLKIDQDLAKIVLINGLNKPMDYTLYEGDVVVIFPPVGGG